jgi:hypothetical protein
MTPYMAAYMEWIWHSWKSSDHSTYMLTEWSFNPKFFFFKKIILDGKSQLDSDGSFWRESEDHYRIEILCFYDKILFSFDI